MHQHSVGPRADPHCSAAAEWHWYRMPLLCMATFTLATSAVPVLLQVHLPGSCKSKRVSVCLLSEAGLRCK
jgi:hypothetical protein